MENRAKMSWCFWVAHHVYLVCMYVIKVVSDYDLSVLSMSVMGFQKKFR